MYSFARVLCRSEEGLCSAITAVDSWVKYNAFLSISVTPFR